MADDHTVNSAEPQWVEGEGLLVDGEPVEHDEPKPIAHLVAAHELGPGEEVAILPSGTKVASRTEGSNDPPPDPEALAASATKSELVDEAKSLGVEAPGKLSKDDLAEKIAEAKS